MSIERCDYCHDIGTVATVLCDKGRFGGQPRVGVCRTHCLDCKLQQNTAVSPVPPDAAMIQRGRPQWLLDRMRICTPECEHACAMHHRSVRRRRCTLSRQGFHCPQGLF